MTLPPVATQAEGVQGLCVHIVQIPQHRQLSSVHRSIHLGVHVKAILTPPCIFCMENHY
jgi:hypothetical protein